VAGGGKVPPAWLLLVEVKGPIAYELVPIRPPPAQLKEIHSPPLVLVVHWAESDWLRSKAEKTTPPHFIYK